MPLFGSKLSFAIEAEAIEQGQRPSHPGVVFGHICYWAAGHQIGDYAQTVILGAPASILGLSLVFEGKRRDDMVDGKGKEEVLALILEALYGWGPVGGEKTSAECVRLQKQFEKFDVCMNSSEAFDGVFAVLIDTNYGSRFIWRDYEDQRVQETELAAGEYEDAMRAFLRWYQPIEISRKVS